MFPGGISSVFAVFICRFLRGLWKKWPHSPLSHHWRRTSGRPPPPPAPFSLKGRRERAQVNQLEERKSLIDANERRRGASIYRIKVLKKILFYRNFKWDSWRPARDVASCDLETACQTTSDPPQSLPEINFQIFFHFQSKDINK